MACGLGAGQERLKPIHTSIYSYDFRAGFEVDPFNGCPPVHLFWCSIDADCCEVGLATQAALGTNHLERPPARFAIVSFSPTPTVRRRPTHCLKPHQIFCLANIKSSPCSTLPCPISCRSIPVGRSPLCLHSCLGRRARPCQVGGLAYGLRAGVGVCTGGHGGGHVSRRACVHACNAVVQM
ncbi:hypothetical protein BC827DRAFT_1228376 [Russula dissimulans]|nr:hypothetical protein BC827DRAFT_1228376 [Russula dissimulans]